MDAGVSITWKLAMGDPCHTIGIACTTCVTVKRRRDCVPRYAVLGMLHNVLGRIKIMRVVGRDQKPAIEADFFWKFQRHG